MSAIRRGLGKGLDIMIPARISNQSHLVKIMFHVKH